MHTSYKGQICSRQLDLNTLVGFIPKETNFIHPIVRQTLHTKTIFHLLKGQGNKTKQRKPALMARSNKKMAKENKHVRSTRSTFRLARTIFDTCQKEKRKSLVSTGHILFGEKRVMAHTCLGQRQKNISTT